MPVPYRRVTRDQPTYPLAVVDELPEEVKKPGRSSLYFNLLDSIANDARKVGRWVLVAEFRTHTGAKDAVDAINKGERSIPTGEWEFQWRKVTDEMTGLRTSNLYAKYHGPLESEAS